MRGGPTLRCSHCELKPRCRWIIGKHQQLQPYRLKVVLVENRRVDGKVKQETVAVLGSIDAGWLPEFWEDTPDELKCKDWKLYSLRHRTAFWEGANQRLKQLANRLGPDLKRIRIAAHKRVPWPKEAERKRLNFLETHHDFEWWRDHSEFLGKQAERYERIIKKTEEDLAENKERRREATEQANLRVRELAKLSTDST